MAEKNINGIVDNLTAEDFVLDKKKYPDVEETPYGFIYNVNGRSITDILGQNRKFGMPGKSGGFTLEVDGDYERSFGPVTNDEQYQSYLKWKGEGN